MNILVIIPARGGSKGIPHKNVKELNGKPLICYSIDAARQLTTDENICVSTDDDVIIKVVEDYGLKVHFKRLQSWLQIVQEQMEYCSMLWSFMRNKVVNMM